MEIFLHGSPFEPVFTQITDYQYNLKTHVAGTVILILIMSDNFFLPAITLFRRDVRRPDTKVQWEKNITSPG